MNEFKIQQTVFKEVFFCKVKNITTHFPLYNDKCFQRVMQVNFELTLVILPALSLY